MSAVLAAIRADYAGDPDNPSLGTIRAAGPDGKIFQDDYSAPQPADGSYDPAADVLNLANGSSIPGPPLCDSTLTSPPPITTPTQLEFDGNLTLHSGGVYRRVRTDVMSTSIKGSVKLPLTGNTVLGDAEDGIFVYLGHSSSTSEVDAGLMWSSAYAGWETFIRGGAPIFNLGGFIFQTNQTVNIVYYPRDQRPGLISRHSSVSIATVSGKQSGTGSFMICSVAVPTKVNPGDAVRAKRLVAIGQKGLAPNTLYAFRGSKLVGSEWHGGQVRNASSAWVPWSQLITTENGAFPYPKSYISFDQATAFTDETGVTLDLTPP